MESTGTRLMSKGRPIPYRSRRAFTPHTTAAQNAQGQAGQAVSNPGPLQSATARSPVHTAPTTASQDPLRALGELEPGTIGLKMRALTRVGVPYTDEEIAKAAGELAGKTEEDAMIAYLQGLGLALRNVR